MGDQVLFETTRTIPYFIAASELGVSSAVDHNNTYYDIIIILGIFGIS